MAPKEINNHIRHGLGSVRAYIHGPVILFNFIKTVFNAVELERHEFGSESFHSELQIGDSVVVLEAGKLPAETIGWTNSIYVYVEDADATCQRAIQLGAESISVPEDKPYLERQAGFRDASGNTWWVSTYRSATPGK